MQSLHRDKKCNVPIYESVDTIDVYAVSERSELDRYLTSCHVKLHVLLCC